MATYENQMVVVFDGFKTVVVEHADVDVDKPDTGWFDYNGKHIAVLFHDNCNEWWGRAN